MLDSGMQGTYTEPALMAATERLAVRSLVPWEWIEEHYGASAFNQHQHQQLPLMTDLPLLQFHADPRGMSVAVHKPVSKPMPMGDGDAYTASMTVITAEVTNKKQLVDDT